MSQSLPHLGTVLLAILVFSSSGHAAELALVPVTASGPHSISGNQIVLAHGGVRVTLELQVSGWGADQVVPPKVMFYRATLDSTSFVSGDAGSLAHAAIPCTTDADCFDVITCGTTIPGFCDVPSNGFQASTFVDVDHPSFVFSGLPVHTGAISTTPDYRVGVRVQDSREAVTDGGSARYCATIILDVSADATGRFTVDLKEATEEDTFVTAASGRFPLSVVAAEIVVNPDGIDCNNNGNPDADDIASGSSADCNGNEIPDECDADCNGNGSPDDCDVAAGTSDDCDGNGVPDECEFVGADCNGNGISDVCDLSGGTSEDCDGNGQPDECDLDCNGNDVPDACEIADGQLDDCNDNGIPDDCETDFPSGADCNNNGEPDECEPDCNGNGTPDDCEVAAGTSSDCNGNGVPDECDPDCNGNGIPDDCDAGGCQSGMALVPITATPGFYKPSLDEIIVPAGATVQIEGHIFGWSPVLLQLYQFEVEGASYVSGGGDPLTLAKIACSVDADCRGALRCGTTESGYCEWAGARHAGVFVDESRPDFVFADVAEVITGTSAPLAIPPYQVLGAMVGNAADSVVDSGARTYAGTVLVDVPSGARGTYVFSINTTGESQTFIIDGTGALIPVEAALSGRITVLDDCNGNGLPDRDDLASGTSEDCDANGFPDECDFVLRTNADANGNGILDVCEVFVDCNENGVSDSDDIASGTSEDCDANGFPDECDLVLWPNADTNGNGILDVCEMFVDCNENGVPDLEDISGGTSADCNGNGIPDDCEVGPCQTGFALVPIDATPGFYKPSLDEIIVPVGATVQMEGRVIGWGSKLLWLYQAVIAKSSYTSGSGEALVPADVPCVIDDDCFGDLRCGTVQPGYCEDGANTMAAAYVDVSRPDFVFATAPSFDAAFISIGRVLPWQVFGAYAGGFADSVPDTGDHQYAATLLVDVPVGARSTYTFTFVMDPAQTYMVDSTNADILVETILPGRITVLDDCNGNGLLDSDDLASGTSEDCDANGFPDECDFVLRTNADANGNGILDVCESSADCNGNGVPDPDDLSGGTSTDCNRNDIPDECEPDCNDNGVPDDCDLEQGCSHDCDGNGVPDECETDCNGNGVQDDCDLASGTSFDCDGDGVPDECSPFGNEDCDGNGVPDVCDIAAGVSDDCDGNGVPDACELASGGVDCDGNGIVDACDPDCDGDGVPDACDSACVPGFALVPISASPGFHKPSYNEIIVPAGASVEIHGRVFGWGPESLQLYQFELDSASYASGAGDPLVQAKMPCTVDADCFQDLRCGTLEPGYCEHVVVTYPAVFVDAARSDFVFAGLPDVNAAAMSTGGNPPLPVLGAMVSTPEDSVVDAGSAKYAGTLHIDVPAGARGTYVFSILIGDETQTLMADERTALIPVQLSVPARITVLDDCNGNGVADMDDLASGTSEDCNNNGFPDECDMVLDADADGNGDGVLDECGTVATIASAAGGRYLAIAPVDSGGVSAALRVTSPDFPCLDMYVTKSDGVVTLSDTPEYLSPDAWGVVRVGSAAIVPEAAYEVVAERIDGVTSEPVAVVTPRFGDLIEPFGTVDFKDIAESVRAFQSQDCLNRMEHADLHPQIPNGVVDFNDIALVVSAFVGDPYPYDVPCP